MEKFIKKNEIFRFSDNILDNYNINFPKIIPKVLLIDGFEENSVYVHMALEGMSIELTKTLITEDALNNIKTENFSLIIINLSSLNKEKNNLANLNILTESRDIPVIFLANDLSKTNVKNFQKNLRLIDLVTTPVEPMILRNKIDLILKSYINSKNVNYLLEQLIELKINLDNSNRTLNLVSRVDSITGLPNRLRLEEYLNSTISKAKDTFERFAVVYLDLDNFKNVNETYGHSVGDELLKEVSKRIKSIIRTTDGVFCKYNNSLISRLGGDEFAIVLSEIESEENVGVISKRIIESIEKPFKLNNYSIKISVSAGIACFPFAGSTTKSLQQAADIAMYKAKQQGKNNFQYYTEELNEKYQRDVHVELCIKKALEKNQIKIRYQPIVSFKEHRVVGCEALCSWEEGNIEKVTTEDLIKISEEKGFIKELGEYVLKIAIKEFKEAIYKYDPDINLHLNLSIRQLEHREFVDLVRNIILENKINPKNIVFELTETALMMDEIMVGSKIQMLHDLGCKISVDDFGTGYSSFSYLKNFPVSSLKIDKSFVEKCSNDNNSSILLKSMIGLAKNLGMTSIVEGIETKEQMNFLKETECNCIQGFYFAKPMSIDSFIDFLRARY